MLALINVCGTCWLCHLASFHYSSHFHMFFEMGGWKFGLSPSRIYLCSLCSYFCVLHYSCSIAKVTSLTPRWSRAQIAISQIRETARISISISKKKPNVAQMSTRSVLSPSLSLYLSISATHTCQASISIQCCGLTVSVSLSNLRNDSERKMSTMPKTHNKGRICDENRKQKEAKGRENVWKRIREQ